MISPTMKPKSSTRQRLLRDWAELFVRYLQYFDPPYLPAAKKPEPVGGNKKCQPSDNEYHYIYRLYAVRISHVISITCDITGRTIYRYFVHARQCSSQPERQHSLLHKIIGIDSLDLVRSH